MNEILFHCGVKDSVKSLNEPRHISVLKCDFLDFEIIHTKQKRWFVFTSEWAVRALAEKKELIPYIIRQKCAAVGSVTLYLLENNVGTQNILTAPHHGLRGILAKIERQNLNLPLTILTSTEDRSPNVLKSFNFKDVEIVHTYKQSSWHDQEGWEAFKQVWKNRNANDQLVFSCRSGNILRETFRHLTSLFSESLPQEIRFSCTGDSTLEAAAQLGIPNHKIQ